MRKAITTTTACLLLLVMVALQSCTKEDVTVPVTLDNMQVCLPDDINQSVTLHTYTVTQAQITAAFASVGATYDQAKVKEAKVEDLSATVETNGLTFDQIGGFEVYAKAPADTTLGTQVAYINAFTPGSTTVNLNINAPDIKALLSESAIIFTVRVSTIATGNDAICFNLTSGKIRIVVKGE